MRQREARDREKRLGGTGIPQDRQKKITIIYFTNVCTWQICNKLVESMV